MLTMIARLGAWAAIVPLRLVVLATGSGAEAQTTDAWAKCLNAAKPDIVACSAIVASENDKEKRGRARRQRLALPPL